VNGYYGLPVLKRPHWKWEIAVYFWLGGIAAGAYAIAAVADVFGDEDDRATVRTGRLIAFPLILVCPLLLIKDLGRPEKFLNMLRIVKIKSPMSAGSWGLFVFGGFSGLSALLELVARDDGSRGFRRFIALLGGPIAPFIGGYTGVLLSATAVPLWARNRLLWGPLFLTSAFSTGLAAIEAVLALTGAPRRALSKLEHAHLFGVLMEAGLLIASLRELGDAGRPITRGTWSSLLMPGTFGLGLGAPVLMDVIARRPSRGLSVLKAACILIGGLALRTSIVYAGKVSADDPEAYFAMTNG
jgi:formate-dependent nitrite reductase membrane component NrfD